jgi:hydroxymethylpyrimidine/phosphomethylpyrimidine kinase
MTAIALTIAGSDSGGGAGIQADLKTFSALGVFGASVLTAITAQNTQGVRAVEDVSPAMIAAQIDAVLDDMAVGGVKIGMVSRVETIRTIAERLAACGVRPVLDPVMVATSGDRLLQPDAVEALGTHLVPLAALVTPNLPEAALLTGMEIATGEEEMTAQAKAIVALGAGAALVKGGHADGDEAVDIFFDGRETLRLAAPRIATPNTHGTGCTLSAAIAARLAKGLPLREAVGEAKDYLHAALAAGAALRIGHGSGPVHHFHRWWSA